MARIIMRRALVLSALFWGVFTIFEWLLLLWLDGGPVVLPDGRAIPHDHGAFARDLLISNVVNTLLGAVMFYVSMRLFKGPYGMWAVFPWLWVSMAGWVFLLRQLNTLLGHSPTGPSYERVLRGLLWPTVIGAVFLIIPRLLGLGKKPSEGQ